MAANKTPKNIHYMRVMADNELFDITDWLKEMRISKPTVKDTDVCLGGRIHYHIPHFEKTKEGLYFHIATTIPNQSAKAINPKCNEPVNDGVTQPPPEHHDFVKKEAFFFMDGFHVIYCNHGLSHQKVTDYIKQLLISLGFDRKISFENVANIDAMNLIRQEGVKEISFGASAYALSTQDIDIPVGISQSAYALIKKAQKIFGDMFQNDLPEEGQKIAENLVIKFSIGLKGNTKADKVAQNFLQDGGEKLAKDDDYNDSGVKITTQTAEIKGDQIKLGTSVSVYDNDGSLNHMELWEEMLKYYNNLKGKRLTEY